MSTKYAEIAGTLRLALTSGAGIPPGSRVISARKLSVREGVSLPTAVAALRVLEAEGLIVARPRSGWYIASAKPSAPAVMRPPDRPTIVTVSAIARELFALRERPHLPLGAAVPQADWMPEKDLRRSANVALRRLGPMAHAYSYPPGRGDLRERIANRLEMRGALLRSDQLIITSGATQALRLALRATTQPGDVVGIESPCYFGTLLTLERLGLRALELPTDPKTGLDLEALQNALDRGRMKALIASPALQNPLGAVMPISSRRHLVRMLASANVPLIEDDLYGEIRDAGIGEPPCKAFDVSGNVLYCGAASKTLAPGWRIGWIAPGRFRDAILELRMEESLAGTQILEAALAEYLTGGAFDRHLRRLNSRIRESSAAIVSRISAIFPSGTRVASPSGGFLLWIELPPSIDSVALMRTAAASGISIAPGTAFSPNGRFRHHIRINTANDATPRLLRGIDRLAELCNGFNV
jgi:DNA-binding transcriptional MocR family regulator